MAAENPSVGRKARPSYAIQNGADLITALIEEEKAKIALQYAQRIQQLEDYIASYTKPVLEPVTGVEDELYHCKANVTRLQMDALLLRQEADQANKQAATLNSELATLVNTLNSMGMVYSNGSITFKSETARAAAQIISEAQSRQKLNQGSENAGESTSGDQHVSFNKPSEFLGVFQVLLERDRRLVEMTVAKVRNLEEERKQQLDSQQKQQVLLQQYIERLENEVLWTNDGLRTHDRDGAVAEIFSSIRQVLGERNNVTRNISGQDGDH